jgi:hypothetical protein
MWTISFVVYVLLCLVYDANITYNHSQHLKHYTIYFVKVQYLILDPI